ncbi:MAG: hypothetical protein ABR978_00350 [Dehalococcoidia bacterium]
MSTILFWALVIGIPTAAVVALFAPSWIGQTSEAPSMKAAIVDQLALSEPNPAFVQSATQVLQAAGYTVDYYPPEQVTVDFYRNLPAQKYGLILFRVHTARFTEDSLKLADPERRQTLLDAFDHYVFLFTSEIYDQSKYPDERQKLQLFAVHYLSGGDQRYFGITPKFIESAMKGGFDNATIVMMGCDGLLFDNTAQTLVNKGAKAVIGWDSLVSSAHTDTATEHLLQHLITERLPLGQAVKTTMTEVGSEPDYNNSLRFYPPSANSSLVLSN